MASLNERSEMSSQQQTPANSSAGEQPQQTQQSKPAKGPAVQQTQQQEESKLSLAELFAPEDEEDSSSEDDPSKPVDSIDGLVKRLKVKPEQVYAIKVPMPNGAEPLTIGQIKDRVGELVDFETREMQFDQRRVKSEGELLRAQTEMRDLLAMLPREHIKPEMVDKVRKKHEATMNLERQRTLEHIPQWQDDKVRSADIKGMIDMLSDYGFDESFLASVMDHRAMKFIRDSYLRDAKIKAALAKVTVPTKKGQRPSGKSGKSGGVPKPNSSNSTRTTGSAPDQRSRIMSIFSPDED